MSERLSLSDLARYVEITLGELMKAVHRGELKMEERGADRFVELEEAIRFCEERGMETNALKRLRKKRVLVVEDDEAYSEMLADVLTADPRVWVRTAATLFEARETMEEFRPHLVFLDANLPDGYGPELMREAREAGLETEFVGITALSSRRTFGDMKAAGAREVHIKPLPPAKVHEIVQRLFGGEEGDFRPAGAG
ncbi:MAG: hypothetical protein DRP90_05070 [Planctomycetota bacterium]|nr:MAG: hypothetical protein DRP90_05070 [Planctomycetota bacterium]